MIKLVSTRMSICIGHGKVRQRAIKQGGKNVKCCKVLATNCSLLFFQFILIIPLKVLTGHEGPISGLVFSPSQPLLVSGSWDKTIRLWNMFDNKVSWEILTVGSDG